MFREFQLQGFRKYFIIVDFYVVPYDIVPLTTNFTAALNITALLAIPLPSTTYSTSL